MNDDLDRYVRYRNCAVALRMAAAGCENPASRREALELANDYDQLANVLEDLMRSTKLAA